MKPLYFILLTTALGAAIWNRKSLPKRVWTFIPLLAAAILAQAIDEFRHNFSTIEGIRSWIFHAYHFIEFICFAIYLRTSIQNRNWRKTILISIPLFVLAVAAYFLMLPEAMRLLNFPEHALTSLVVVVGTLVIFYEMYTQAELTSLSRNPDFWLGTGNLLFYTANMLALGGYTYAVQVMHNRPFAYSLLDVNHFLNLLLYFLYIIAFLCPRKKVQ